MAETNYISKITVNSKTYDVKDEDAVLFSSQSLTDAQKTQARTNIGAGTSSFSGSYDDLTNKPDIPDMSTVICGEDVTTVETTTPLNADTLEGHSSSYFATASQITNLASVASTGSYADLTNKPTYATVATSGSYNDLSNKPTYATVATSGSYTDLSNKPNDNQLRAIYIGTSDPSSSTGNNGDIYVKYSS